MLRSRTSQFRSRAALLAAVTVGVAGVGTATAATTKDARTTVKGRVEVIVAMKTNGSMKTDTLRIATVSGKRYDVRRTRVAAGLESLAGQQVVATGPVAGNALAVDEFHRVDIGIPPYRGAKRAAIIRVRHASTKTYKASEAKLRSMVFTGSNSIANMWKNESRGALTLSGDVYSEVMPDGTDDGCVSYGGTDDARSKHPGYDFYLYVSNSKCGFATGKGMVLGPESWYFGGMDAYALWHEMGHNLGFHHSNRLVCSDGRFMLPIGPSCGSSEYGDRLTPMGQGPGACAYDAYQDVIAGWDLPYQQTTGEGTFQLRARNLDGNGMPRALVIPGAPAQFGGFYLLEWRTADYPSCGSKGAKGIQIRVVDNARPGLHTNLVDMTPDTETSTDAALKVGAKFRDPMTNMSITLLSQDTTTGIANVQIKLNDPAPAPPAGPPTVTVMNGVLKVLGDDLSPAANGDNLDIRDDGPGAVLVSNRFPVVPGAGCVSVTALKARCSRVTKMVIDGRWGADVFTVQSVLPVDVNDTGVPSFNAGYNTFETGPSPDGPVRFLGTAGYTIDYSARTMPLTISLDGVANDGAAGELDNVGKLINVIGGTAADQFLSSKGFGKLFGGPGNDHFEAATGTGGWFYGGPGDDTMIGSTGSDQIHGDDGDDTIELGAGSDSAFGDAGRDVINAKDGLTEYVIDCGADVDSLTADAPRGSLTGDATTNCEHVSF